MPLPSGLASIPDPLRCRGNALLRPLFGKALSRYGLPMRHARTSARLRVAALRRSFCIPLKPGRIEHIADQLRDFFGLVALFLAVGADHASGLPYCPMVVRTLAGVEVENRRFLNLCEGFHVT